jgi:hypothetical protein
MDLSISPPSTPTHIFLFSPWILKFLKIVLHQKSHSHACQVKIFRKRSRQEYPSPMQVRLDVSGTGALSARTAPAPAPDWLSGAVPKPLSEPLPDSLQAALPQPLAQVTSEFPFCTSSTSRFVLAMEVTNRNTLCDVGARLLCLNLRWVLFVISSMAFLSASPSDESSWSKDMAAVLCVMSYCSNTVTGYNPFAGQLNNNNNNNNNNNYYYYYYYYYYFDF